MSVATLGGDWALDWMKRSAKTVNDNRAELIKLDTAIGDGDHGDNLDRGFRAAIEALDAASPSNPGEVFKLVAMTLMSKVGGAAGPLYGSVFLKGAKAVDGTGDLDSAGLAEMLAASLAGLQARGKATTGEKTMVDAWTPAVEAARDAAEEGKSPTEVLRAAAVAAVEGSDATIPMVATKGRASYLGQRSAGHRDPGSQSTALILAAAADAAEALG